MISIDSRFWEILIADWDVKILVFARMLGVFAFTPILSRNNFPVIAKVGVSVFLTYILTLSMALTEVDTGNTIGTYVIVVLKEMFVGLVVGFLMNMFIYSIQIAGDIMDSQSGIGMAKVFDPATRVQMSIFGTFISFLIYMYFFATNSHFTLIKIFMSSYEIVPLGYDTPINPELGMIVAQFFNQIMILMMKLALPIIAVEMIMHFSMGVLMKVVPQIQIMVVNIQLMVTIGFLTLFIIAAPISEFIDNYVALMLENAESIITEILA